MKKLITIVLCLFAVGCGQNDNPAIQTQNLAQFEALDKEQAKLAYVQMDEANKKELWKQQLEQSMKSQTLSTTDKRIVKFTLQRFDEAWKSPDAHVELLRKTFDNPNINLFTSLGSLAEGDVDPNAALVQHPDGSVQIAQQALGGQNCTTNAGWACGCICTITNATGYNCNKFGVCTSKCSEVGGCGFLLLETCNRIRTRVEHRQCTPELRQ